MAGNIIQIANFDNVDPDTYFICPYDPIHKIIAKRFPYHVMKCRKNWNGRSMLTCVFNARHIVPASEHRHHINSCPDRKCIEADIAYQQRKAGYHQGGHMFKGQTDLPTYEARPDDTEEDWDTEASSEPATGYNPADYPGPPVSQNLTGYTAAQKRQFHGDSGTVNYKKQEEVNGHPHRPFPTDSDRSGNVYQPYQTTAATTSAIATPTANDMYNHEPHQPGTSNPTNLPYGDVQSTASGFNENKAGLRLPRQPARASAMATGTSNSALQRPKKSGGRIAANIFNTGSGDVNNGSPAGGPDSAALAHNQTNGQNLSGFPRPAAVGIGRGLVPPGLGRGFIPGIGRGVAKGDGNKPGQMKK